MSGKGFLPALYIPTSEADMAGAALFVAIVVALLAGERVVDRWPTR